MFSLKGKKAVITGGGSGIGRAISELFGAQGAEVHILELNEASGQEVADKIKEKGGKAEVHACDVSNQKQVKAFFNALGAFHILINNAGIANIGTAESTTEEEFDKVLAVNVKGVYNCLHAGIPQLKKSGNGVILNMASIASLVGIPDRFAYSMAKGAVKTMTMSVARDYLQDHIRCNSISPARVHTPFVDGYLENNYPDNKEEMFTALSKTQPIGRMGKPEEIAALALYLCSDEAGFITGCDYPIDGGFTTLNN